MRLRGEREWRAGGEEGRGSHFRTRNMFYSRSDKPCRGRDFDCLLAMSRAARESYLLSSWIMIVSYYAPLVGGCGALQAEGAAGWLSVGARR